MASLWPLPLPSATFHTSKSRISATSNPRKTITTSPELNLVQTATSSDSKGPWWCPLFRTIIRYPGSDQKGSGEGSGTDDEERTGKGIGMKRSLLTAEKARVLRKEMRATENWHDAMYHSAIASRLASPDDP